MTDNFWDNEDEEEEDEEIEVDECVCNECGGKFDVPVDEELRKCPVCDVTFD